MNVVKTRTGDCRDLMRKGDSADSVDSSTRCASTETLVQSCVFLLSF